MRSWYVAIVVASGTSVGCEDSAPDGAGLMIEMLTDQPRSTDLGISLAVHARGGRGVSLSVEQGSFLAGIPGLERPPTSQTSGCISGSGEEPFSFALSIRPSVAEALLFAALYSATDCSGQILQSRVVAIRPPAANPVPRDAGAPAEAAP